MTKILLTNYPRMYQDATFTRVGGNEQLHIMCGYDINVDNHQITLQIVNDLISAILTYDNVFIKASNVWDVLSVFGSINLKELLRDGILKIVPDQELNPVMMLKSDGWEPEFFGHKSSTLDQTHRVFFEPSNKEFAEVETIFYEKGFHGIEANSVLMLLDENKVTINSDELKRRELIEMSRDIETKSFVDKYSITRTNNKGLREFHKQRLLRLHELNTTTIMAGMLYVDGVKTDGNISQLLSYKIAANPLIESRPDGISAIQEITKEKDFPDLGVLFHQGIIDLEDILKLRSSFQGKMFRYWNKLDNYEETELRKDVMNSVHNVLGSKLSNAVRFITTNVVGLCGFIPGLAASAFDSYIISKIAKGWHPNFFLDDKLKNLIERRIEVHEREEKAKLIREQFKGVRPNDPCPCGSGKKFKKCHGKFL